MEILKEFNKLENKYKILLIAAALIFIGLLAKLLIIGGIVLLAYFVIKHMPKKESKK